MADWQVALVNEQGVEFAVVAVKDSVINNHSERDRVIGWWQVELGRPVVLLGAQRHKAVGRRDLAQFVANVGASRLPWQRMRVAA